MKRIQRWLTFAAAPLLGAAFYASSVLPARLTDGKLQVLAFIDAAATGLVFIIALLSAKDAGPALRRIRIAFSPAFFTAASLGFFMLIESDLARYALAVLAVALLAVYFIQLRKALHPFIPLTLVEFAHLGYAMHVVSMFFAFAFSFGITLYVPVPAPVLAAALGAVGTLVALETFKEGSATPRETAVMVAAIGILAAELQAAVAFLPTSHMVNAAVAIILYVLALHVFKHVLAGMTDPRALRRHFAFSTLLVVLVLFTARWA